MRQILSLGMSQYVRAKLFNKKPMICDSVRPSSENYQTTESAKVLSLGLGQYGRQNNIFEIRKPMFCYIVDQRILGRRQDLNFMIGLVWKQNQIFFI